MKLSDYLILVRENTVIPKGSYLTVEGWEFITTVDMLITSIRDNYLMRATTINAHAQSCFGLGDISVSLYLANAYYMPPYVYERVKFNEALTCIKDYVKSNKIKLNKDGLLDVY